MFFGTQCIHLTRISYNHFSKYYVQMCKKLQLVGTSSPDHLPGLTSGSSSVYSRPLGEFSPPAQKNQKSIKNKFYKTEESDARIHGWMTLTKNWSRFAFTI